MTLLHAAQNPVFPNSLQKPTKSSKLNEKSIISSLVFPHPSLPMKKPEKILTKINNLP